MKSIEIQAKTIDEAITKGCAELGVGIGEVDFDVVDEGGLFRKMKVKITLKEGAAKESASLSSEVLPDTSGTRPADGKEKSVVTKPAEREAVSAPAPADNSAHEVLDGKTDEFVIEGKGRAPRKPREPRPERPVTEFNEACPKFVMTLEFAKAFFEQIGTGLTITTSHNDREYIIEVHGQDVSRLIGKEGKTLAAINSIISSIAINHHGGEPRRVIVDIENYREKRRESLVALASRKAEYVKESGKSVKLEPMPARERVIIHTALQDMEGISTHSVGDEPNRYLVISPSAR